MALRPSDPNGLLALPEGDVLGDGERRDEHEVLVDHPDPGGDGVARRAHPQRPSVEQHLAGLGPLQAEQHTHQGALAGAVLAEEGVDLPGANVEVNVVVGDDAGEPRRDAAHL